MEYIAHRINSISELRDLPTGYGVEIDLRDGHDNRIYIAHDPFKEGEDFEDYLKWYRHGTMILNIKSEGIEYKALDILRNSGIEEFFFLDSSFPMINALSQKGISNIALRFSEFEGSDTLEAMKGMVKWVWVDCFTRLPLDKNNYSFIKGMKYKLCLVSPELQGRSEDIEKYKAYLKEHDIVLDAICTKHYNISRWL